MTVGWREPRQESGFRLSSLGSWLLVLCGNPAAYHTAQHQREMVLHILEDY